MSEAFYLPDGPGRFLATELTRGPWDPLAQHAGPPAALLGRAVERFGDRADLQTARVTFEIMRPVPIAALQVATRRLRDGRSVDLVEASLTAEGQEVMRATALRIRGAELPLPPGLGEVSRLPGPGEGRPVPFFPTGQEVGYHTAMEWRFVAGSFLEPGPATVWLRMRQPLLPGEAPSPLVRVLAAADSGNGVSAALDYRRWLFINADLTVYLVRPPVGEWVALEAATTVAGGVGLARSIIHDQQGPVGRGLQALFVDRRR
ncbi:MAG TPA: thioesterase family protein [Actinomycetota bacterium]|nr:thioesterase family protein [Actinomycetota bacterium]